MRAYRIPSAVTALILTLGLVTVACSGDDSESSPSGGDDAGVGGTGGTGGTSATGGAAGEAGTAGTAGSAGQAGMGGTGGGTGATGGTGGNTGGTGGTGGATCDGNGFDAAQSYGEMYEYSNGSAWIYRGATDGTTYNFLQAEIWESYGAPTTPGTYTLEDIDTGYDTCGACFIMQTGCTDTGCSGLLMPNAGGTYTITDLGEGAGDNMKLTLNDVTFREVTLDQTTGAATDVPNGSHWCVTDTDISADIAGPHVSMPQPSGMSCDYPAPPYDFLGPEDGETAPEPGTVPPMAWPGAFFGGQETGFDLAQYRCDHPEIKTLVIITGAGWCSACKQFMEDTVCGAGGLEEQLHALNAELLYVWGDNNTPGSPATNAFADTKISSYGCDGGFRLADIDNTAGARVVFATPMSAAYPWAAIIRMEDMKLTHEQSEESQYWLDFLGIAAANNQ
jgi:hypothetical protein